MSQEESKSSLRSRVDGEKARFLTRQDELFGQLQSEICRRLDSLSEQIQQASGNGANCDQSKVMARIESATMGFQGALHETERRLKDQISEFKIVMSNHQVSTDLLRRYERVTELTTQRLDDLVRPLRTMETRLSATPDTIRQEIQSAVAPLQNFERSLSGCFDARLRNFDGIFNRLTRLSLDLAPQRKWTIILIAILSHLLAFATGLLICRFLWPH